MFYTTLLDCGASSKNNLGHGEEPIVSLVSIEFMFCFSSSAQTKSLLIYCNLRGLHYYIISLYVHLKFNCLLIICYCQS